MTTNDYIRQQARDWTMYLFKRLLDANPNLSFPSGPAMSMFALGYFMAMGDTYDYSLELIVDAFGRGILNWDRVEQP